MINFCLVGVLPRERDRYIYVYITRDEDVYPQAGSRYQPVFEIEMVRWYDMGRGGPVLPTTTTRKKPRLQLINLMRSYTDGKIFSFT